MVFRCQIKSLGFLAILILMFFCFGCNRLLGPAGEPGESEESPAPSSGSGSLSYNVSYNGNGNDAGSAPVDSNTYLSGASVTVLGAGTLTQTGYSFTGWNTASDGSGTAYAAGVSFSMGSANVTLYAQWSSGPVYTVTYDGNGSDGGSAPADGNNYLSGASVTVSGAGTLTQTGYSFAGWNTVSDGSGTSYAVGATFSMGSVNVILYAQWTPLSSDNTLASVSFSGGLTLSPSFSSATLSYSSYANGSIPSVTVTAVSSDGGATLQVQINGGGFTTLTSGTASGTLVLDNAAGSNVITIRVTASNGAVQDYVFTIAKTVSVTIVSAGNGVVAPAYSSYEMSPGNTVALSVTPDPGYRFKEWTGTGLSDTASPTAVLTVPGSNTVITGYFEIDFSGGDGTVGNPYQVSTVDQLKNISLALDKYYVLMGNLDLATETSWTPIGNSGTPFQGGFNGGGFTISNLTINDPYAENQGLFGVTDGATIQNVHLTAVNIAGGNYTGGLIGHNYNSAGNTTVTNCSVSGDITAVQSSGGLIGTNESAGLTVTRCWANVTLESSSYGNLGILIGRNIGGVISECYAVGTINGSSSFINNFIGGLVGWNENGTILNSYANVGVTGADSTGGLVGYNLNSSITNCYSSGLVMASTNRGGLVGQDSGSTITSSFYDQEKSLQSDTGKGTGKTTAEMTLLTTFSGWDFTTVWTFSMGSYPYLQWTGGSYIPVP